MNIQHAFISLIIITAYSHNITTAELLNVQSAPETVITKIDAAQQTLQLNQKTKIYKTTEDLKEIEAELTDANNKLQKARLCYEQYYIANNCLQLVKILLGKPLKKSYSQQQLNSVSKISFADEIIQELSHYITQTASTSSSNHYQQVNTSCHPYCLEYAKTILAELRQKFSKPEPSQIAYYIFTEALEAKVAQAFYASIRHQILPKLETVENLELKKESLILYLNQLQTNPTTSILEQNIATIQYIPRDYITTWLQEISLQPETIEAQ